MLIWRSVWFVRPQKKPWQSFYGDRKCVSFRCLTVFRCLANARLITLMTTIRSDGRRSLDAARSKRIQRTVVAENIQQRFLRIQNSRNPEQISWDKKTFENKSESVSLCASARWSSTSWPSWLFPAKYQDFGELEWGQFECSSRRERVVMALPGKTFQLKVISTLSHYSPDSTLETN